MGWSLDFADPQTMLDPTFNGENIIPRGNSNWPELDVPEVNKAIDDAKLVTDPAERAQAWADVNHSIVEQAPRIPYMWDYQTVVDLAERPRRAERLQHDLGLQLHVAEVARSH